MKLLPILLLMVSGCSWPELEQEIRSEPQIKLRPYPDPISTPDPSLSRNERLDENLEESSELAPWLIGAGVTTFSATVLFLLRRKRMAYQATVLESGAMVRVEFHCEGKDLRVISEYPAQNGSAKINQLIWQMLDVLSNVECPSKAQVEEVQRLIPVGTVISLGTVPVVPVVAIDPPKEII